MAGGFKNFDVLDLGDSSLNPEEWVRAFFSLNGIKYHYKTNSFHEGPEIIEVPLLISKMRLAAYNLDQSHLKGLLPDAVAVLRKELERKFLSDLVLHYRNMLMDKKLKASTINRRLAAVRSLLKLARTFGIIAWGIEIPNLRVDA